MDNLVFLTIITARNKKEVLVKLLTEADSHIINTVFARDYIEANLLRYAFGLVPDEDKVLINSVIEESAAHAVLDVLCNKFNFKKPKTGVAFTVKIDGTPVSVKVTEEVKMEVKSNMKALYIIANAGYADDVADIARKAGIKGATIINGRGKSKVQERILGINTDAEIETIICIADEETAQNAMESIKQKAGKGTPANCISFMIPIDKASVQR